MFVRLLGLKSKKEWQEWSKSGQRPSNIPSTPAKVYRGKGWVSMPDWLGCERNKGGGQNKGVYLSYEEARAWVRLRNLKSQKEWKEWSKSEQRPSNIPGNPWEVYRGKGWVSMMDFLGFEGKRLGQEGDYLPFKSARAWARQRNLKSAKEWREWSKSGQRPSNIPSAPWTVYRDKGWVSIMDFLGFEGKKVGEKGDYLPFKSARAWVHQRKLKSQKEWKEWSKSGQRPSNIPSTPDQVYRGKGWVSMPDWLGCERNTKDTTVKRDFLPYEEARAWVQQHCNLKSKREWKEWSKSGQRPSNIPSAPHKVYRGKGWVSMPDWLGCERNMNDTTVKRDFLSYEEARAWVHQRKLKSHKEWREWSKSGQRPNNIPSAPDRVYRGKGWVSYMDFMGFEGKALSQNGDYLPFVSARAWVRERNLKSANEWQEWSKSRQRPSNIPGRPDQVYRDKGWVSWPDWLGTSTTRGAKGDFLPFAEARALVRQRKLKSKKEWQEWSKSGQRPSNIPSSPHQAYQGKGWVSYPDWLGKDDYDHAEHCREIGPTAKYGGAAKSSRRGVLLSCPNCRKETRWKL
eukprot:g3548.t1